MSGTNPSKRPNDNDDEESAKRRKEKLEEFELLCSRLPKPQGNDRGRSQTRSTGGHGGSLSGNFHQNENVQDDTQSLVPAPTPGGTLGFGMFGANSLFPQTAIGMSDGSLLSRLSMARLGNGYIDISTLGSNDLASVANFTGNGLVPYSATQGLAQRVAQAQDQSILMQHCYQQGLIQGQSNQVPVQAENQRTQWVSTNPPEKSWSGAPRLPKGSKARAKEPTRPRCDRLDLRLKKYTDENGIEKSLINVVTFDGRATNLVSPVQCLNPGVTMGITSLGDRTVLNKAIEIAGRTAEHKDKPHMGHVWYLIGPVLRRPDSARDGPPSARYDRVFLSSSQEDIDLPPKISGIGKDGNINMPGRSDMERVIQERDELIKQLDQAIHDRNALIAIFRTGNPYLTHDTDELLDRDFNAQAAEITANNTPLPPD
ncbi:unnamed protein product [Clonostachys solani]|uniref:Uncharacterized protein n=1 Tax=Clonostachys solani TaxID=160281 RepID=A0A9N9YPA7_9HYPO|nr:unnamed protein product [Clonostachys solani]